MFSSPSNTINFQYYLMRTPFPHKNCPPLWLALSPQMMTLKRPPTFCSSKSHKYDNYDKAPDIVSSYHQSHKANLKVVLAYSPQAELTPPPLPQHTNKVILKCTFSTILTYNQAKLKKLCYRGINVQLTIQDMTKEDRLCMKSPTPDAQCTKSVFLVQSIPPICAANFANKTANVRLNMTQPLKPI